MYTSVYIELVWYFMNFLRDTHDVEILRCNMFRGRPQGNDKKKKYIISRVLIYNFVHLWNGT